ncbi:MAG: hypothetical protein IRZ16_22400 [Myxococcaceae bacterium]|nr:hypothetical protein [Myxococcaceae bacterium]
MLSLTLAQAPSASGAPEPEVVVLPVVRPRVISRELAERTADAVREGLVRAGYDVMEAADRQARLGKQDPADCQNNTTCFALIGRSLRTPVVVRVEGGVVETDLAVYLQALRSEDGSEIAAQSIVTQTDAPKDKIRTDVAPFIARLLTAFPPRPRLKTPSLPPHDLATLPPAPPPEVTKPAPHRPLWPLAPTALGVVSAGIGTVFLIQAGATHAQLVEPLPPGGTPWSKAQREELRDRGNFQQTLGWALVGAGAVATVSGAAIYFMGPTDANVAVTAGPGGVLARGAF